MKVILIETVMCKYIVPNKNFITIHRGGVRNYQSIKIKGAKKCLWKSAQKVPNAEMSVII